MPEKVYFDWNTPVTVALQYTDGREVTGRFGKQWYYTLTEPAEHVMYLDPDPAAKLRELRPAPGERIVIEHREIGRGRSKQQTWVVEREGERTTTSAPPLQMRRAEITAPPAAVTGTTNRQPVESNCNPLQMGVTARLMGSALVASVDALVMAQKYAEKQGLEIRFGADDVRATANTFFIQAMKTLPLFASTTSPASSDDVRRAERVNGGTQWPQ